MAANHQLIPDFRSDWYSNNGGGEQSQSNYLEKRQLFLRSYQFSRKKSFAEEIKSSLVKVNRFVWQRLRSARNLRKIVWSRLCSALCYRIRFSQVLHQNNAYNNNYQSYFLSGSSTLSDSSCFR